MKSRNRNKPDFVKAPLPDKNEILDALGCHKRPMRLDALLKALNLARHCRRPLEKELQEMESAGTILRLHGGLWCLTDSLKKVKGRYQPVNNGGLVIPLEECGSGEIFIHPLHAGGAWPKDLVEVALVPGSHGGQGRVVKIIERPQKEVAVQIVKKEGPLLLCRPTDRRLKNDFSVRLESGDELAKTLKPGLLLSVRPEKRLSDDLWSASLVNIFGAEDSVKVQEALVKCNHPVPSEFPELALEQAANLPVAPSARDMEEREDWRHLPFVTIDGADARDFDDAIHVERTPEGWLLRVAIADVSHYVKPDSREGSLDSEARKRGNSWYFPTSVEPMLPKALSNGLCSLKPNEERLAMMVEIPVTLLGEVKTPRFAPIAMRSAARLVYEDVAAFFEAERDGKIENRGGVPSKIMPMLREAFSLYEKLAEKRRERGTLDFELPEPAYNFDDNGRLKKMSVATRNDANQLIEEFMIAANEAVAEHLTRANVPFLYRVHPVPEPVKMEGLYETLVARVPELLPPGLTEAQLAHPRTIQKILQRAKGTPYEYVVNRLCLRSMSQARYQPENQGHFGLASRDYCHFTSPIRRYADLLTHRALKYNLGLRGYAPDDVEELQGIGDELNVLEREALECEREMARRMGCLALKEHEGKTFRGTVSGVTNFGIFIELSEIPTEGLIRVDKLGNDWFMLDPVTQMLIGEKSGVSYRLGQEMVVTVREVDLDRLEVKLEPAEPSALGPRPPKGRQDRRKGKGRFQRNASESGRKSSGGKRGGADKPVRRGKSPGPDKVNSGGKPTDKKTSRGKKTATDRRHGKADSRKSER